MITTSISEFRKDIKSYINRVIEDFETILINRGKDIGVIVMSIKKYNSLRAQSEKPTRPNTIKLAFGAWEHDGSAEDIIKDIRESRHTDRQIETL